MRIVLWKWLTGAVILAMTSGPAAADWLVTRLGPRVETRGPWRIDGPVVVFSAVNGRLSSLRVADVDFEASERLSATGLGVPSVRSEAEVRQPRHVITGNDVPKYVAPRSEGRSADETAEAPPPSVPLRVTSWNRVDAADFNGFEIVGSLRNDGRNVIARIELEVQLYRDDGSFVGSWSAFLDHDVLPAGRSTKFRLPVSSEHWDASDARFEVRGEETLLRLSGSGPTAEGR